MKIRKNKGPKIEPWAPLLKYLPKMNIARLVPLSVFKNLRIFLLYLKAFLITHFVLVWKSSLHATLYRMLWKYEGTRILLRNRRQKIYICHMLLIEVD